MTTRQRIRGCRQLPLLSASLPRKLVPLPHSYLRLLSFLPDKPNGQGDKNVYPQVYKYLHVLFMALLLPFPLPRNYQPEILAAYKAIHRTKGKETGRRKTTRSKISLAFRPPPHMRRGKRGVTLEQAQSTAESRSAGAQNSLWG